MDNNILIHGGLRQFSLDSKKNNRGWLILVSDENEYFVQQNSFLFRNFFPRTVYKIGKEKLIRDFGSVVEEKKHDTAWKIFLSIPIVVLIRIVLQGIIPKEILFGKANIPVDFVVGTANIMIVLFIITISFYVISYYRRRCMNNLLNQRGIELEKIGTLTTNIPLGHLKGGVEGSNKSRKIVAYIVLLVCMVIPFLIIIPFFIQLRGLSLSIVFLGYLLFFNGNYGTDGKIEKYKIKMRKRGVLNGNR